MGSNEGTKYLVHVVHATRSAALCEVELRVLQALQSTCKQGCAQQYCYRIGGFEYEQ